MLEAIHSHLRQLSAVLFGVYFAVFMVVAIAYGLQSHTGLLVNGPLSVAMLVWLLIVAAVEDGEEQPQKHQDSLKLLGIEPKNDGKKKLD